MDDVYAVKKTSFLGKPVLVICQNINGPCPLLAICNVLLLRGHLAIESFVSQDGLISAHDLMRVVQSRLVSTNPLVPGSSELAHLTREKTLQDVIALLPSLLVGLDVNVRFHKITDFEYTVECAVFDMLDIALVHGWLLDAQDASTLRVVQNKSYNELVAHLVEYRSVLMTESSGSGDNDDDNAPSAIDASTVSAEAQGAAAGAASPSVSSLPAETEADAGTATASPPFITPSATDFTRLAIDTTASEQQCASPASPSSPASAVGPSTSPRKRSPSKQTVQVMMQERAMSDADALSTATVLLEDGPVLEEFFASSASQLTYYGLVKLHEEVRERQLCVFFRNNHFSTLFKFDGSLYLLVTDAGYLDEPSVAWERLDEIDGDSEYVDANFRSLNVSETNQQSILTRQEEAKQRALQAQAHDATLSSATAAGASEHSAVATTPSDDPDYLYALQLQQEEEARAKRVSPPISPRRQPSPVSRQAPAPAPITAAAIDDDARSSRDNSSSYDRDESSNVSQFDDASAGLSRSDGAVDAADVFPAMSADGELLLSAEELEAQRQAERFYQERKRQHDQQTYQLHHQQQQQQQSRDSSARRGRQSKGDSSDCSVM